MSLPKTISNCTIKPFQMLCIILVIYLSYEQLQQYLKNEDSSSVSFRNFNQEKRDLYPTFSICVHSEKGGIISGGSLKLSPSNGSFADKYHEMLIGKEKLHKNFQDINFNHTVIDILEEFVEMFVSYTKQGKDVNPWNRHEKNPKTTPSFHRSYQDPYFRCITKSVRFVKDQILHYDYLVLNSLGFYNHITNASYFDNSTNIFLYVHHTGQLIKEFGKQAFQLNILDFQNAMDGTNNYREVHISTVEVVRKRFDGVTPCNDELEDEDRLWIESVVRAEKCIPIYWKGLNRQSAISGLDLPVCNSSIQYDEINKHYLPPNNFYAGTKLYKKPCSKMKVTLSHLQKDLPSPEQSLVLEFNYNTEEYRETLSHRAFGRYFVRHKERVILNPRYVQNTRACLFTL